MRKKFPLIIYYDGDVSVNDGKMLHNITGKRKVI